MQQKQSADEAHALTPTLFSKLKEQNVGASVVFVKGRKCNAYKRRDIS